VRPASEFSKQGPDHEKLYIAVSASNPKKPLLGVKAFIDDPLRLMRHVHMPADGSGVRVGIRLKMDYNQLAKFSISFVQQ